MKKISVILVSALILYIIYYDLKIGTLPTAKENSNSNTVEAMVVHNLNNGSATKTYYEVKVKPGDTVLSIIEKNSSEIQQLSITQIIQDFKKLNPKVNPEKIQIGKRYKFPLY